MIYPWAGWSRGNTLWRAEPVGVENSWDDLWIGAKVFAVNLAYTINSIEKIEIIQNGDQYFSNEDWTIKSLILSVGALQSPVEVYSADNLNKRFSGDGSRIIINKEELTNNLAYQKMLENKNCGN